MTLIKRFLTGLLFLICPLFVYADIKPTEDFYVNDYANIINYDTKKNIIDLNEKLYNKTGAQIVIVTINSLDGNSLEEYSYKIFNDFGIGDKNKNNGILILLSKNDRQIRVEIGKGLEETLNDAKVGRMMDKYIIPYLKQNEFNKGLENGFNAFFNYLIEYYNITDISAQEVNTNDDIMDINLTVLVIVIIFIIILIMAKNSYYDYYGYDGYSGGSYYDGGHSSGGHFGGGGSSGGGGASRGF